MKVFSVVGARPQFIKAAVVSRALSAGHEEVIVHTGQHYDVDMSGSFFRDLELRQPDVNLGVGSAPHAEQTAEMMRGLEPLALGQRPDGFLVYGDTNSTLAAALVAAKLSYPDGSRPWLAHVEAGLRSFNRSMPEERNRVVADHLSDLLLAPTSSAMRNLEREGLGHASLQVGDVMVDAFEWAAPRADGHLPQAAAQLPGFMLLTVHRPENVDNPARLGELLAALPSDRPVVFPIHPRTKATLARGAVRLPEHVRGVGPVGYLEMVALERAASVIATDSGGVQKEAYLAGVPCVTLRSETEWTETVEAGWNRLAPGGSGLREALADAAFMDRQRARPELFGDGNASARVVSALEDLQRRVAEGAPRVLASAGEARPS